MQIESFILTPYEIHIYLSKRQNFYAAGTPLFQQGASGRNSQRPFVHARSTKAAKETVDHLDATQDHLQAACGQKSSEEPDVKLHDVLGLQAPQPFTVLSQVFALTI